MPGHLTDKEVESTGLLCGGAVLAIARELLQRRGELRVLNCRIETLIGVTCNRCERGDELFVEPSTGFYTHTLGGNYCDAHKLHSLLDTEASKRARAHLLRQYDWEISDDGTEARLYSEEWVEMKSAVESTRWWIKENSDPCCKSPEHCGGECTCKICAPHLAERDLAALTNEEKVKRHYPQAWADKRDWSIWSLPWTPEHLADSKHLGHGITERAAWKDAASRLNLCDVCGVILHWSPLVEGLPQISDVSDCGHTVRVPNLDH